MLLAFRRCVGTELELCHALPEGSPVSFTCFVLVCLSLTFRLLFSRCKSTSQIAFTPAGSTTTPITSIPTAALSVSIVQSPLSASASHHHSHDLPCTASALPQCSGAICHHTDRSVFATSRARPDPRIWCSFRPANGGNVFRSLACVWCECVG